MLHDADCSVPAQWEYRTLSHDLDPLLSASESREAMCRQLAELNSLGREGWELVAVVPITSEDRTSEIRHVSSGGVTNDLLPHKSKFEFLRRTEARDAV